MLAVVFVCARNLHRAVLTHARSGAAQVTCWDDPRIAAALARSVSLQAVTDGLGQVEPYLNSEWMMAPLDGHQ